VRIDRRGVAPKFIAFPFLSCLAVPLSYPRRYVT